MSRQFDPVLETCDKGSTVKLVSSCVTDSHI